MPSNDIVGVWNVPSGESGAGRWVFDTGLTNNTGVTVWSYHNNQWLKIGDYWIDKDGKVTVSFTADQLSPILITKNGMVRAEKNTGKDNNLTGDKQEKTKVSTINESPKTGDNNQMMIVPIILMLLLGVLAWGAFVNAKKTMQINH